MIYARMRKYTRDIEERYKQDINLKQMVRNYIDMPLEGMDVVAEENERQSKWIEN